MKKFIVYCFTINSKKYIGYTQKSMVERLEEHIKEALAGSERHFCRAIRKYGLETITSEILFETTTKREAELKERYFIKQLGTFNNGYNMTKGGDGGNSKERYTKEQLDDWGINRSKLSSGMNNGNARPDITKEDIINVVLNYIREQNKFREFISRQEIDSILKSKLLVSSRLLYNRGIKNHSELIRLVNQQLQENEYVQYDPYHRSENQKKKLSKKSAMWAWVTNGKDNIRIKFDEVENFIATNESYYKGRTNNYENY